MSHTTNAGRAARGEMRWTTDVQRAALAVGIAFLVVGIAGFIPGVTTNYDQMEFAGHESGAQLLGVFQVSVLHNLVHLLFGLAGIAMARRIDTARSYLIGGGLVYLALFVYGLVVDKGSDGNVVPVDDADDWLHLGLGVAMVALGLLLTRDRDDERRHDLRGRNTAGYVR